MKSCLTTNQGSGDQKGKERMPAFTLPAWLYKQQPAAEVGKAGGYEIQTEYGKICRVLLTFACLLTILLCTNITQKHA